jgi:hypothetical protein
MRRSEAIDRLEPSLANGPNDAMKSEVTEVLKSEERMAGREPFHEESESLWFLVSSPVIWAAHLLLCYGTAAVWCAKVAGYAGPLTTTRIAIAVYTVVALAAIVVIGWIGYRRHRLARADVPHDDDTPEDRHRFMGFATFLLSALSAVAVIYQALVAVFVDRCV